jgi:hypothetical protein
MDERKEPAATATGVPGDGNEEHATATAHAQKINA